MLPGLSWSLDSTGSTASRQYSHAWQTALGETSIFLGAGTQGTLGDTVVFAGEDAYKKKESPGEGDKQHGIKYHPTSYAQHLSRGGHLGSRMGGRKGVLMYKKLCVSD